MTAPTATQDNIAQRRARVAQLRLRGLSSREICIALAKGDKDGKGKIISPRTGRPYDHVVILEDLTVLKAEWKEARGEATDTHIDREFTEIQEIKRAAWATSDPELALKALDREMSLLGTKKAQEVNLNVSISIVIQLVEAIERRGESASKWFEEMLQDMRLADSNPD